MQYHRHILFFNEILLAFYIQKYDNISGGDSMIYLFMFIVLVCAICFSSGESSVEKKVEALKWQNTKNFIH